MVDSVGPVTDNPRDDRARDDAAAFGSGGDDDLRFALLDTHPNAPRQGPVWLAFSSVVVAGVLGGLIGSSLVAATCSETPSLLERVLAGAGTGVDASRSSCTWPKIGGGILGGVVAALGTAVVAVLVLRAMAEWRRTPPRA
jgi:hypothetical protein